MKLLHLLHRTMRRQSKRSECRRSAVWIGAQYLAIGERNPLYDSEGRAVLGRMKLDLDHVARLQRPPGPVSWRQHARRRRLDIPVLHVAFIIGHVEMNLAMWIGPFDLHDGGLLKGRHGRHVVARI